MIRVLNLFTFAQTQISWIVEIIYFLLILILLEAAGDDSLSHRKLCDTFYIYKIQFVLNTLLFRVYLKFVLNVSLYVRPVQWMCAAALHCEISRLVVLKLFKVLATLLWFFCLICLCPAQCCTLLVKGHHVFLEHWNSQKSVCFIPQRWFQKVNKVQKIVIRNKYI